VNALSPRPSRILFNWRRQDTTQIAMQLLRKPWEMPCCRKSLCFAARLCAVLYGNETIMEEAGSALFPHLCGPLQVTAVRWVKPLRLDPDGRHVFPKLEEQSAPTLK
jgi:hypothetical protein